MGLQSAEGALPPVKSACDQSAGAVEARPAVSDGSPKAHGSIGSEALSPLATLAPLMAAVFTVFLVTGIALPALPLHVQQRLGLGTFVVGIVSGAQFAASLISRVGAGAYSDTSGAKRAAVLGLALASAAGLLYLLSLVLILNPVASASVLVVGRAALGAAESFVIVGAQSWGLALAGPEHTGKVIAWLGLAMYGAFAVGAPIGSALYAAYGFAAIAVATLLGPLAALIFLIPLQAPILKSRQRADVLEVAAAVFAPGAALALASVGFGVMSAFSVLLFVERGWRPAWLSYTMFALAFVAARALFGNLPDRRGGARIAALFAIIEAAGFALLWVAPWPALGFAGAALVGFGYSLVFPGLGAEAVSRVSPSARGLAIGVFTAYLDLALGLLLPALGWLGGSCGLGSVFLVSAALSLLAAPVAAALAPPLQASTPRNSI
jgi:MFS family permease